MDYHFRNLVFEGGGVKGIAYLGALEVLEDKGILRNIRRIGGTSAGAINAILLGLGFSRDETREILWALDFNKFKDNSWGVVRNLWRLLDQFGWYKGDYFQRWIEELIERKTGSAKSTFADVEAMKEGRGFKSLYFMGTNLSTSFAEIFSAEHTPDMRIADAVRISMSIPLFFTAKRRGAKNDVYVDGGVLDNYPVKLFDRKKYLDTGNFREPEYYEKINAQLNMLREARGTDGGSPSTPSSAPPSALPISSYVYNKETLGFRLDTKEEISVFHDHDEPPHKAIDDCLDYTKSLVAVYLEAQQNTHLHSDDWARTVYIDTLGVKTTDFGLSDERKKALVASGREGASSYFAWYDSVEETFNK